MSHAISRDSSDPISRLEEPFWSEGRRARMAFSLIPAFVLAVGLFLLREPLGAGFSQGFYVWFPMAAIVFAGVLFVAIYMLFWRTNVKDIGDAKPNDRLAVDLVAHVSDLQNQGLTGHIYAISGEGQPLVYSDRLLNAMRDSRPDVKADVLAGPLFLLDDRDTNAIPPLFQMARSGLVRLYVAKTRIPKHFVTDGSDSVYIEDKHEPSAPTRKGYLYTNSEEMAKEYKKRFKALVKGDKPKAVEFNGQADLAGFVTKDVLTALKTAIKEREKKGGPRFNQYRLKEFQALAAELRDKGQESVVIKAYGDLNQHFDWTAATSSAQAGDASS